MHREDADTVAYLSAADTMHKIVLAAESETALWTCAATLEGSGIAHKLWIELPESVATCLALKPYRRGAVKSLMAAFKLLR